MAGRYLATELQDDNGDIIYPHTEADIVFASDGTTIEENLSGEVTSEDMQEIFSNTQPQTGNKLSVKEKIKKAFKKYQALLEMKILDTVEEVEANTDEGYLMGARAGAELINDLAFPDGTKFYPDKQNGKYGFNTSPARGADTFIPFFKIRNLSLTIPCRITAYAKEYNISLKIVVKDGVLTGTWTNLTNLQEIITRGTNFTENLRE